jgi:hypothetical protein
MRRLRGAWGKRPPQSPERVKHAAYVLRFIMIDDRVFSPIL